MTLDDTLLASGEAAGTYAATMKTLATILRDKPLQGGCVLLGAGQRDKICDYLEDAAELLDGISIAVELDAEALSPDGDEETRL